MTTDPHELVAPPRRVPISLGLAQLGPMLEGGVLLLLLTGTFHIVQGHLESAPTEDAPRFGLFMIPFELTAVAFLGIATAGARKRVGLLRRGVLDTGNVVAREATRTKINGRRVHAYTLRVEGTDGTPHTAVTRATVELRPGPTAVLHEVPGGEAMLVASMPARPHVGGDGQWSGELRPQSLGRLLAAAAAVALNLGLRVGWL